MSAGPLFTAKWFIRFGWSFACLCCVGFEALSAAPAYSQSVIETKQAKELELELIKKIAEAAKLRQEGLKTEIEALNQDIAAINRALIASAKRGQQFEAEIDATESELRSLGTTRQDIKQSLQSKNALLSQVIGALQRMGRNPPPAILIEPKDVLSSIRSAILLGSVVPEIRVETETLLVELKALAETTRRIEEQKSVLSASLNALAEDESRLSLLINEKKTLTLRSNLDMKEEQEKAKSLADKATTLSGLIRGLEEQISSATAAANAAREADEKRKIAENKRLADAKEALKNNKKPKPTQNDERLASLGLLAGDASRKSPAISFSKAQGLLPYPVSGIELFGFKNKLSDGSLSPNIAMATRPNARVISPADGWVVYAGPFRSYGQVLILNAGEDYHLVLSGMAAVDVEPGRFVLAGEPVGKMGLRGIAGRQTIEAGSNRPVLYVEFKKGGKSFDPAPWWAPRLSVRTKKGLGNDS